MERKREHYPTPPKAPKRMERTREWTEVDPARFNRNVRLVAALAVVSLPVSLAINAFRSPTVEQGGNPASEAVFDTGTEQDARDEEATYSHMTMEQFLEVNPDGLSDYDIFGYQYDEAGKSVVFVDDPEHPDHQAYLAGNDDRARVTGS